MPGPMSAIDRRSAKPYTPMAQQATPSFAPNTQPFVSAPTDQPASLSVTTNPALNMKDIMDQFDKSAEEPKSLHPTRDKVLDTIGRAMYGFGRGYAAVDPKMANGNAVAAGIASGLGTTGQLWKEDRDAATAERNAKLAPRKAFLESLTKEAGKQYVEDSYKQAADARSQANHLQLEDKREKNQADLQRKALRGQAAVHGVPEDAAQRYYNEATQNVQTMGITPDTPGFDDMVNKRYVERLEAHKKGGQAIPKPQATPKGKPKTASEYLGQ